MNNVAWKDLSLISSLNKSFSYLKKLPWLLLFLSATSFASSDLNLDNLRFSELDAYTAEAFLANNIYKRSKREEGVKFYYGETRYATLRYYENDITSGFNAGIYETDDGRYIVAFGGTFSVATDSSKKEKVIDTVADVITDLFGLLNNNQEPKQVIRTRAFMDHIVSAYEPLGKAITLTGHSLGGALAQYATLYTGYSAVTFNTAPAPVTSQTVGMLESTYCATCKYSKDLLYQDRITNIMVWGDPLTSLIEGVEQLEKSNYAPGTILSTRSYEVLSAITSSPVYQKGSATLAVLVFFDTVFGPDSLWWSELKNWISRNPYVEGINALLNSNDYRLFILKMKEAYGIPQNAILDHMIYGERIVLKPNQILAESLAAAHSIINYLEGAYLDIERISLTKIKINNPEMYAYIDGSHAFSSHQLLAETHMPEYATTRYHYYVYTTAFEPMLDLEGQIYFDKAIGKVALQAQIEEFASRWLNIAGLGIETAVYATDALSNISDEAINAATKRRIVESVLTSGQSELEQALFSQTEQKILDAASCWGVALPSAPSIQSLIEDVVGLAAKQLYGCAIGEVTVATGRVINSTSGVGALNQYYYRLIAKTYLDVLFGCGVGANDCIAGQLGGSNDRDEQLKFIIQSKNIDTGNLFWNAWILLRANDFVDDYLKRILDQTNEITKHFPSHRVLTTFRGSNIIDANVDIKLQPMGVVGITETSTTAPVLYLGITIENQKIDPITLSSSYVRIASSGVVTDLLNGPIGLNQLTLSGPYLPGDSSRVWALQLHENTLQENDQVHLMVGFEYTTEDGVTRQVARTLNFNLEQGEIVLPDSQNTILSESVNKLLYTDNGEPAQTLLEITLPTGMGRSLVTSQLAFNALTGDSVTLREVVGSAVDTGTAQCWSDAPANAFPGYSFQTYRVWLRKAPTGELVSVDATRSADCHELSFTIPSDGEYQLIRYDALYADASNQTKILGGAGSFSSVNEVVAGTSDLINSPSNKNCASIKTTQGISLDGNYIIDPDLDGSNQPFEVYCHEMNTAEPKEYLNLFNTGQGYNFGMFKAGGARPGIDIYTHFTKIRINPENLLVDIYDRTFSTSVGAIMHGSVLASSVGFGTAADCIANYSSEGRANVNLEGTPFSISNSVEYFKPNDGIVGWRSGGSEIFSSSRQVADIIGGGYCGQNLPRVNGKYQLQLSFLPDYTPDSGTNVNLTNGLVAHYEFEGNANDSSGNGNNGVENGGVTYTVGVKGQAASFDGVDDYILINVNAAQWFENNFSFSAWVKFDNFNSDFPHIFMADDFNFVFHGLGPLYGGLQNHISFYQQTIPNSSAATRIGRMDSSNSLNLDTWYFVTIVKNDLNFTMYINSEVSSQTTSEKNIILNGTFMAIGSNILSSDPANATIDGSIDDLRIYNRALNTTEVSALYNLGNQQAPVVSEVSFISENFTDYSLQLGDATKRWSFNNSATSLNGLKAIIVSQGANLGINQSEVLIGDVPANTSFDIELPITPIHGGAAIQEAVLKLVDGAGNTIPISNSATDTFRLKLRTNHPPQFNPNQSLQLSGLVNSDLILDLTATDTDGDALSFSITPTTGVSLNGNRITANFNDGLLHHTVTVAVSDGIETTEAQVDVLTFTSLNVLDLYADVNGSGTYDNFIAYATLQGLVIGNAESGIRNFYPNEQPSWSELLKMMVNAAVATGAVAIPTDNWLKAPGVVPPWVDKYYTTARLANAVDAALDLTASPTNEDVTRLIVKLLGLDRAVDGLNVSAELAQFTVDICDAITVNDCFNSDVSRYEAQLVKLHGLFMRGINDDPQGLVTRAQITEVMSRMMLMPSATLQLNKQVVEFGGSVALSLANLSAPVIKKGNDFILSDSDQPDPVNHMIVDYIVVDDVTISSSSVAMSDFNNQLIDSTVLGEGLHTAHVKLENTNNGTYSYQKISFEVSFTDSDYDGVQDINDLWPNNSLYSDDENGNGIPDFADLLWGLNTADSTTQVMIDGVLAGYTYGEALTNNYYFDWADDDFDGVPDLQDAYPLDQNEFVDSDGDGIGDNTDMDDDNDLIPDSYELLNGLNPFDSSDASSDYDADGLTALEEFNVGTRADLSDTDFDGDSDSEELAFGTDPNDPLDNINAHRPYAPVLGAFGATHDVNNVTLYSNDFSDPDELIGDVISSDQWQLSKAITFDRLTLDRIRIEGEMSDNGTTFNVPNGLLQTSLSYYYRARHRDITGLWSDWSAVESFNTLSSSALDLDADGVADFYQVNVATDVDNNGIDDSLENTKVVYESVSNGYVGINLPSGVNPPGTAIINLSPLPVSQLPAKSLLLDKVMPYGMFEFMVDVTSAGIDLQNPVTVEVTLHFPDVLPQGTIWLKFDTVTNKLIDYTDHVTFFENTATVSLTDGGLGDLDKVVNGYILDPGGPVLPINPDDVDNDGIANALDNCLNVANPAQVDVDNDGFGNYCDADFTNDGIVNALDLGLFKQAFFTFGNVVQDLNGDGVVNSQDLGLFKQLFFKPPGPSGLMQ